MVGKIRKVVSCAELKKPVQALQASAHKTRATITTAAMATEPAPLSLAPSDTDSVVVPAGATVVVVVVPAVEFVTNGPSVVTVVDDPVVGVIKREVGPEVVEVVGAAVVVVG